MPDEENAYFHDDCVGQFDDNGDGTTTVTVFRSADNDEVVEEIIVSEDGWEKNPDQRIDPKSVSPWVKAFRLIQKFRMEHKEDPTYANVQIHYKDTEEGECFEDTIKLNNEEDKDDDQIFFYASGVSDFLCLFKEDNGEDFVLTDIFNVL